MGQICATAALSAEASVALGFLMIQQLKALPFQLLAGLN